MMGQHGGNQDRLFYSFNLDAHVPADHLLRGIDRFLDLTELRQTPRPVLQPHRPSLDRPGADGADAAGRLLLRHSLGASTVRGSAPQPRVSLVLPPRPRGCGAGSLELLEEPARPVPRQRCVPSALRDGRRALHHRRAWSAARASRSTRASSAPMRTAAAACRRPRRLNGRRPSSARVQCASIWLHSMKPSRSAPRRSTCR
jgi:hypothetical protein